MQHIKKNLKILKKCEENKKNVDNIFFKHKKILKKNEKGLKLRKLKKKMNREKLKII